MVQCDVAWMLVCGVGQVLRRDVVLPLVNQSSRTDKHYSDVYNGNKKLIQMVRDM